MNGVIKPINGPKIKWVSLGDFFLKSPTTHPVKKIPSETSQVYNKHTKSWFTLDKIQYPVFIVGLQQTLKVQLRPNMPNPQD